MLEYKPGMKIYCDIVSCYQWLGFPNELTIYRVGPKWASIKGQRLRVEIATHTLHQTDQSRRLGDVFPSKEAYEQNQEAKKALYKFISELESMNVSRLAPFTIEQINAARAALGG